MPRAKALQQPLGICFFITNHPLTGTHCIQLCSPHMIATSSPSFHILHLMVSQVTCLAVIWISCAHSTPV